MNIHDDDDESSKQKKGGLVGKIKIDMIARNRSLTAATRQGI